MIYTVRDFCDFVGSDLNGFIDEVATINRNVSDEEKKAYAGSYPVVAEMLTNAMKRKPSVGSAHISTGQMLLEYKLPAASAWCDLVLLGDNEAGGQEVIIVELKNYLKNGDDAPGDYEGLMLHKGMTIKHPADQVKGYTEYCRRFHSTVHDYDANVNGCVYFTQPLDLHPYSQAPNDKLTSEYPMYNKETSAELAEYIIERIDKGNEEFATRFVDGFYQQDRNILRQVAKNLQAQEETAKPFVLLDEQRLGFNLVMSILQKRVKDGKKEVIIVQGPPGSGKSAIAINVWIEAVMKYAEEDCGNIVYVTTSSSQSNNWQNIFNDYGKNYNAKHLTVKSTQFNPGMNGKKMKEVLLPLMRRINKNYVREDNPNSLKYEFFEDYLDYMLRHNMTTNYKDNLHFMSVVDEAHALINPSKKGFRTGQPSGWCFQMGPQAYHIIRESQVSVFFMDDKQSFRDNETTSIADIEILAEHLGANISKVSLNDMQFRCAGSKDYVDWIDYLFTNNSLKNSEKWKNDFTVKIVDYPSDMENELRKHLNDGNMSCRILSAYSTEWISSGLLDPQHSNEDTPYDFDLEDKNGKRWKKCWNYSKKYDVFVQAKQGTKMAEDPLSEVGCPYVVRGFDYDYVGLLWLNDIFIRNGKWMVSLNNVKETGIKSARALAFEEQENYLKEKGIKNAKDKVDVVPAFNPKFPAATALFNSVAQAYRINMTRAMKELTIYIKDPETREFIKSLL